MESLFYSVSMSDFRKKIRAIDKMHAKNAYELAFLQSHMRFLHRNIIG